MRAKLARCRYLRFLTNLCALQRAARGYLQRRHQAATLIQAAARVWLARRTVQRMHEAATTIQVIQEVAVSYVTLLEREKRLILSHLHTQFPVDPFASKLMIE